MHRLFLIVSLLVMLVALVLRRVNADRLLRRAKMIRLHGSSRDMAEKMLASMGHGDVKLEMTARANRIWAGMDVVGEHWIRIPVEKEGQENAYVHGLTALRVGLYLLSLREPRLIARRRWAIRFGHVFPIFATMVAAFVMLTGRASWSITIVMSSLAMAACVQVATFMVERRAAELATVVLEKKRIYPRLSDEEAVSDALRGWSWFRVLPGILARLT
ncbi:zinc metallopeptidase [Verrucomicrobiaceae bacterium N1E253]|uniref:Zinc metallopeptidase n=1 Tax=Oceaniferula marina TaxID=2748318 RepID=A0A851GGN4_9BACT|nr:zinc metallopeptidase [Oceaniferula marina]NWK55001.1 zinc metallopeptidase [Oceaniferula marina]